MATRVAPRVPGALLGMMLFISSEVMFFGGLFGAYFTLRSAAGSWPPAGTPDLNPLLPGFFSAFLIASSFTQHAAGTAARRADRAGLLRWVSITIALGVVFLAGQALEYSKLISDGFTLGTNVYGTLFFTMTGFHGLHVLAGLAALVIVVVKARAGDFDRGHIGPVEAVTAYWHFVDVVWILLFSTLYLLR
jgi:cytochrome c oxidase subunit 3